MVNLRKSERELKKRMKEEEKEVEKRLGFNANPSNFALIPFNPEIYQKVFKFLYKPDKNYREEIIYFKGAYLVASQLREEVVKQLDKEWKSFPLAVTHTVGGKEATIHGILDYASIIIDEQGKIELKEGETFPLDTEKLEGILKDRLDKKSLEKLLRQKRFNWDSENYSPRIFVI